MVKQKFNRFNVIVLCAGFVLLALLTIHTVTVFDSWQKKGSKIDSNSQLEAFINAVILSIKTQPLKLELNEKTVPAVGVTEFAYLLALAYYYITRNVSVKDLLSVPAPGPRDLTNPGEIKTISDKDPGKNIILTNSVSLSLDTRATRKNLNALVIGSAGTGKTRSFVKPNIMQHNTSYVITDPKGELFESTAELLEAEGYAIRIFNLLDMGKSHCYNPFAYIRSERDVLKLVDNLIKNTGSKVPSRSDPLVQKGETALLQALFFYLYYEAPPQEQNFNMVMEMIRAAEIQEEEGYQSRLDLLFKELEENQPEHLAVKQYKIFQTVPAQTAKSILVSAGLRLSAFNIGDIAQLTTSNNLELETIGDKKTALFVIISDNDDMYNFLVAMMYEQIFDILYDKADFEYGGRLPVHVRFMLDDFANIGQIPQLEKMVATMGRREISISIIVQNAAQLKTVYPDSWESIAGNCDSLLFLGGQDQSTLEYITKQCRDLITAEKISQIPDRQCILLIRGMKPLITDKFILESHQEFVRLREEGNNRKIWSPVNRMIN